MPNSDEFRDPAVKYLVKLGAELLARGLRNELITLGCTPRLSLVLPGAGMADSDFEDNILAASEPDGQWRFWWPWIEPIGPVGDTSAVADYIMSDYHMGGAA